MTRSPLALAALVLSPVLCAQSALQPQRSQVQDEEYTAQIREHTTDPCFLTPYVDHLPASDTVPTPLEHLGHIAGAPDVLSYSSEVHGYMRAVAEASPRVRVSENGTSEEGREFLLVAVGSEEAMADLDRYVEITNKLADPRAITDAEAAALIPEGKAIYWATGAIHSPETGSPEMLMELVYRLAVEETPFVQAIRDNLIFLTTPVVEPDGRDKRVDLLKLKQAEQPVPRLLYWGKYVAHDNNRDGMILGLELSRMLMRTFLKYKPTVLHDLHESASHLYTSTGTGPYNAWIDPILVDEWHVLAYREVTELTRLGVPGVWTHDFYDGWACNYAFYAANGHNSIGRFYETQGAGDADTRTIRTRGGRAWFRPNPPLPETKWSIRNNVNLQQSGLLVALHYVAGHKDEFLENFYLKGKRSVQKPHNEGPAAYVLPADDTRQGQAAALLRVLQRQGVEVHRTAHDAQVGELSIPAGSHVVRMDQPYSRMADMMLDRAYYNVDDPRPYDDTGWTLGPLFNARTVRVEDVAILDVLMEKVEGELREGGGVLPLTAGEPVVYLVDCNADKDLPSFRFAHPDLKVDAAEQPFELGGVAFRAGAFLIPVEGNPDGLREVLQDAGRDHGFAAYGSAQRPAVPTHPVRAPRVALAHTWTSTQNEGWVRMALDQDRIPYDYISVHELRDEPDLRGRYDVILLGPSMGDPLRVVEGLPMTGDPIPWKASETAPNIGRQDETDDMRGGLGLEGVLHLRDFVQHGGVLVCLDDTIELPIHFGLARNVSLDQPEELRIRGTVLSAEVADETSPLAYGYDKELGVMLRRSEVLRTGGGRRFRGSFGRGGDGGSAEDRLLAGQARPTGRGGVDDPDRVQGRPQDLGKPERQEGGETDDDGARGRGGRAGGDRGPRGPARDAVRTVVRFHPDHDKLLVSGMLAGGDRLAGTPAVVDAPLGEGHVVLFHVNPMWRHETQGHYAMVYNAMLHFDSLHAGTRAPRREAAEASGEAEDR